ncbi:MAG: prolipoprotein diacylglyceryl transferase [Candidatus Eremiobacteraeota bacterium]|nr:prolipoprotein diacylglyceryl transferase [Candidatus Eremiobacteraeota bacterium]MDQ6933020.1 prolipoprotein diacylglyceryl transferase [Candidatus Eremiobacteraeota bacterium]
MQHWFNYPNIDPIALHLGPLSVHWYGLSYLAGFICVYLWMNRPAGRRRLGLDSDEIQDFLIYALVGVLAGGRALFVIADMLSHHNASEYLSHPVNFIAVWNGGMAFHGGLIGVIVAVLLYLRKHPGLSFGVLGDEIVVLLPVGIALTRIVNFINDELPGRICQPDHPYCINFPNFPGGARYPSQLLESLLDFAVLPVLLLIYRRRPPSGVVAWSWFTLYGITRSVAEMWRQPDIVVAGITGGQLLALPMIVIGILLLARSGIAPMKK